MSSSFKKKWSLKKRLIIAIGIVLVSFIALTICLDIIFYGRISYIRNQYQHLSFCFNRKFDRLRYPKTWVASSIKKLNEDYKDWDCVCWLSTEIPDSATEIFLHEQFSHSMRSFYSMSIPYEDIVKFAEEFAEVPISKFKNKSQRGNISKMAFINEGPKRRGRSWKPYYWNIKDIEKGKYYEGIDDEEWPDEGRFVAIDLITNRVYACEWDGRTGEVFKLSPTSGEWIIAKEKTEWDYWQRKRRLRHLLIVTLALCAVYMVLGRVLTTSKTQWLWKKKLRVSFLILVLSGCIGYSSFLLLGSILFHDFLGPREYFFSTVTEYDKARERGGGPPCIGVPESARDIYIYNTGGMDPDTFYSFVLSPEEVPRFAERFAGVPISKFYETFDSEYYRELAEKGPSPRREKWKMKYWNMRDVKKRKCYVGERIGVDGPLPPDSFIIIDLDTNRVYICRWSA